MIRIAIYSGAQGRANGLEAALRADANFELVLVSPSIGRVMAAIDREEPDIVLVEPAPGLTSVVLRELQWLAPQARIVLWVDTISTPMAMEAIGMGIRGILRKSLPSDLQLDCLRRVQAGELWFEKALTGRIAEPRSTAFTAGEQSLLELLTQGLKNREIASRMALSEAEVAVHLSRLFEKSGVKDRFELALYGLKKMRCRTDVPGRASRGAGDESGGDITELRAPLLPTLQ